MKQISKELNLELQKIIKEEYGEDLSFTEINKIADGLVDYFDLLAKIYYKHENEK